MFFLPINFYLLIRYGKANNLANNLANKLEPGMSRGGNGWHHAVAKSVFSCLKKKRIRKQAHKTRDLARTDIFNTDIFNTLQPFTSVPAAIMIQLT